MATRDPTTIRFFSGKCDVCGNKDGHMGHNLQQCKECKVLVHEACYGLEQTMTGMVKRDWTCLACSFVQEAKDCDDQEKRVRPHDCVLCSVHNGVHAMHPIYDMPGPEGKPLQRRSGPAWAHTLCCMFIGSHRNTGGYIYGCNRDGKYDSVVDSDDEEEQNNGEESEGSSIELHHFVICNNETDPDAYASMKEHRNELRCAVCKQMDHVHRGVLRLPLECCTGDDAECRAFTSCHQRRFCHVAMHVGCARWKHDDRHQRVFFWPGMLDSDGMTAEVLDQPLAEIYCGKCASDIHAQLRKDRKAEKRKREEEVTKEQKRTKIENADNSTTNQENSDPVEDEDENESRDLHKPKTATRKKEESTDERLAHLTGKTAHRSKVTCVEKRKVTEGKRKTGAGSKVFDLEIASPSHFR